MFWNLSCRLHNVLGNQRCGSSNVVSKFAIPWNFCHIVYSESRCHLKNGPLKGKRLKQFVEWSNPLCQFVQLCVNPNVHCNWRFFQFQQLCVNLDSFVGGETTWEALSIWGRQVLQIFQSGHCWHFYLFNFYAISWEISAK